MRMSLWCCWNMTTTAQHHTNGMCFVTASVKKMFMFAQLILVFETEFCLRKYQDLGWEGRRDQKDGKCWLTSRSINLLEDPQTEQDCYTYLVRDIQEVGQQHEQKILKLNKNSIILWNVLGACWFPLVNALWCSKDGNFHPLKSPGRFSGLLWNRRA